MPTLRLLFFLILVASLISCGVVDSAGEGVNERPSVSAPTNQLTVLEQQLVELDSEVFSIQDDFGIIESYSWSQISGETVEISNADQPKAHFMAPIVLENEGVKELAFELTVTDNFNESGSATLTVRVQPVNAPPLAGDDVEGGVVDEGASAVIRVVANDTDSDGTVDPATLKVVTAPPHGTAVVNADGTVTYTHDGSETPPTDSFTYTVNDNEGRTSNEATVSISVRPVNDPPQITGQSALSTPEETPLVLSLDNLVVTDPDSVFPDEFTLMVRGGKNYSVSGATITPSLNFDDVLRIPVVVDDGSEQNATSAVFDLVVNVIGINDAPVITGQVPLSTPDGTPLTIDLRDLKVTDPDNRFPGDFTLAVQDGVNYSVSGTTITPDDPEFIGNLTVPVSVNDGSANSNVFNLVVQVVPQNDLPVAIDDSGLTDEGASIAINVIANDSDSDGLLIPSTVDIVTSPRRGTAVANASGTVTYTHDGSETTSDSFAYTVSDNEAGTSNVATVSITINPINDPPKITGQTPNPLVTEEQTPLTISLANVIVTDPDSPFPGNFSLTVVRDGLAYTRDPNNPNIITPNEGFTGDIFPPVIVNDGSDNSDAFTLRVNVVPAAEASFASQQGRCWTTPQGQSLEASLADPQASPSALYSLVTDATKGVVTITDALTGAFRYDPDPKGERGADTFIYRIDDPLAEPKTKTATVIVEPRIMVVGDSISAGLTDAQNRLPATGQRVGFRQPLYEALLEEGYRVDLVGGQRDGEAVGGFDPDHEAHLDWTAAELAWGRNPDGSEGIFAWLEAEPADLVLVHAGSYGLTSSVDQIAALLDEIGRWEDSAGGNPVTVVVAKIIDRQPSDTNIAVFNANLETMVRERTSNPAHPSYPDDVWVADLHGALSYPQDLADDGLHPSTQGYSKLSDTWYQALTDNALLVRCP